MDKDNEQEKEEKKNYIFFSSYTCKDVNGNMFQILAVMAYIDWGRANSREKTIFTFLSVYSCKIDDDGKEEKEVEE